MHAKKRGCAGTQCPYPLVQQLSVRVELSSHFLTSGKVRLSSVVLRSMAEPDEEDAAPSTPLPWLPTSGHHPSLGGSEVENGSISKDNGTLLTRDKLCSVSNFYALKHATIHL